ncbi:hypothetical protein M3650_30915, partial [Paenibacillus sp. MER TA 81-3]|nr:hypothetical protein [Paenibacillus sp. MER TA 81-3]
DRQRDVRRDAEPRAIEDAPVAHFTRQRADDERADAQREIFARRVEQPLVFGIAKMFQIEGCRDRSDRP